MTIEEAEKAMTDGTVVRVKPVMNGENWLYGEFLGENDNARYCITGIIKRMRKRTQTEPECTVELTDLDSGSVSTARLDRLEVIHED